MSVAPIFRLAGSIHLAASTTEATGLLGHALPLCGSQAGDLALLFVLAYLLCELGDLARSAQARLRARRRARVKRNGK